MLISSGASGGFSFIAGLRAGVLLGLVVLLVAAPWGLLVVASSFVLSQIAGPLLIKVIKLIGGEENIDGLCFLSGFLSSFILMVGLLCAAIGILIAGGVSTIISNAIPGLPNDSDFSKRRSTR